METVRDIIVDALEDLVVQADEAPIEPSEAKAAIRALNRMMAEYATKGINIGYTIVDSLDDEITVPLGAMDAIVANLAIRLAPKYKAVATPELTKAASDGEDALYRLDTDIPETQYPETLAIGSGNTQYGDWDDVFYPDQSSTILAEQGGSIGLESSTEEDE